MKELELYNEVMADVDKYTGVQGHRMPRYEIYDYPQRLSVLSDSLQLHTLREIGDIKRYLMLQEKILELSPDLQPPPIYSMIQWLDSEMDAISKTTPEKDVVVISLLAFGKEYISKMLGYTFKSLMAIGNLPCLVMEKQVIVYIQTDAKGMEIIEADPITLAIRAIGVHFDYAIIPDRIIKLLNNSDITYWMLGAGASLGLHYAKSMSAVFHHSFPDIVYSDKFFSELLRLAKLGHTSILASGMRSDESLLIPKLLSYQKNPGILSIPSADLISHHLNSLHIVAWPYMVNNRQYSWTYPQNHIMIWESPEYLHINSPHLNALWLDYSITKDLPPRYFWTMDSEMDLICKGENFYIPQEGDEIYQAELSTPERASITDRYSDAITCARGLWTALSHRDLAKFFLRGMRLKINPEIRKNAKSLSEQQISSEMNFLFNAIQSTDPYAGSDYLLDRTHAGRIYG